MTEIRELIVQVHDAAHPGVESEVGDEGGDAARRQPSPPHEGGALDCAQLMVVAGWARSIVRSGISAEIWLEALRAELGRRAELDRQREANDYPGPSVLSVADLMTTATHPFHQTEAFLLDGRNRLAAIHRAGAWQTWIESGDQLQVYDQLTDPYRPVGEARRKLIAGGDVENPSTRTDTLGREQPVPERPNPNWVKEHLSDHERASGDAFRRAQQRVEEMAQDPFAISFGQQWPTTRVAIANVAQAVQGLVVPLRPDDTTVQQIEAAAATLDRSAARLRSLIPDPTVHHEEESSDQ